MAAVSESTGDWQQVTLWQYIDEELLKDALLEKRDSHGATHLKIADFKIKVSLF